MLDGGRRGSRNTNKFPYCLKTFGKINFQRTLPPSPFIPEEWSLLLSVGSLIMQLKFAGRIRSMGGEQVRWAGSSLHWIIFSFFHFMIILFFWQKNNCLWGESWDLGFSKYIYIFLLNLSENNYGNSSAEARTDVLLKLQLSSVNMHKSWEGGVRTCSLFL